MRYLVNLFVTDLSRPVPNPQFSFSFEQVVYPPTPLKSQSHYMGRHTSHAACLAPSSYPAQDSRTS